MDGLFRIKVREIIEKVTTLIKPSLIIVVLLLSSITCHQIGDFLRITSGSNPGFWDMIALAAYLLLFIPLVLLCCSYKLSSLDPNIKISSFKIYASIATLLQMGIFYLNWYLTDKRGYQIDTYHALYIFFMIFMPAYTYLLGHLLTKKIARWSSFK